MKNSYAPILANLSDDEMITSLIFPWNNYSNILRNPDLLKLSPLPIS